MWLTEDAFDNSRLKIIPIIGPKGMGKSVLAWQVYRHRSVVGRFDCRAWCNVISRTSSWPDVAAQLLDSLETRDNIGLPLWNDDKPVMELKAHLRGRRFLLVLDGLDYQPTLTAMEETLRWCPYTAGSVVVVTTCSESLVLTCDAYSFMHLKTQPSIVDAFMNRALAMVPDMPYSMAVVVRKILSRFSTDPFYMKMLIHLLYVNPSRTTQELQGLSSRLADDEPLTNAMQMFMFSYDELPSHYKSCLLYLTIFPQGCTIRRKSLIRRWVVEGLVSSTTDGLLPALEVADRCFDELLDRGFVIPVDIGAAGKVKTCRLDATVHDSITLFARQENLVDTNYLLPSTLAPRLSISNGITPQHLLKRLKLITVLDLEGCQGLERRHFKIICNKLYQLKYLCLRRTNVTRLPKDINKLRYLETLDVRETQVLCHVEVSHNTELDEISHLQQLRKLGVVLNGKDVDLKHLLGTINELSSCLRSLSIRIKELPPPYWVEGLHMPDPLFKRPPKFLESLSICGLRNELPYWIQELHQLVKITLSETFLTENALRTLGQLKGLRCLRLRHNSFVATKLAFGVSEFRNLKFLVVEPTHITNISFSRKAVPKLEKIVWSFSHIQSISGISAEDWHAVAATQSSGSPSLAWIIQEQRAGAALDRPWFVRVWRGCRKPVTNRPISAAVQSRFIQGIVIAIQVIKICY
ncbi:hypothetical protein QOZ80_9BG0712730 [Eleusine coracana subsp. coracana]|nr:hypothetical protein QOZ80_9BG0712730 [Eleusine coracana subsp. coracana]